VRAEMAIRETTVMRASSSGCMGGTLA